jgi:hypothetical protein
MRYTITGSQYAALHFVGDGIARYTKEPIVITRVA